MSESHSRPETNEQTGARSGVVTSRRSVLLASLGLLQAPRLLAEGPPVRFTEGVASGDVTHDSAVLWARAEGLTTLNAEVSTDPSFRRLDFTRSLRVSAEDDFTAKVVASPLKPGQTYFYRWRLSAAVSDVGRFKTAPAPEAASSVHRFAFSGDTDGTKVGGVPFFNNFEALDAVRREGVDAFFYIGDTIYSDSRGGGQPVARSLDEKRALYRLNRRFATLTELMRSTSTYAIWDDHEVIDDFDRTVNPTLAAAGRKAFLEYMPINEQFLQRDPDCSSAPLFRAFHWGRDVDIIILDTRACRSPKVGDLRDKQDAAPTLPAQIRARFGPFFPAPPPPELLAALTDPARTMLGHEQKERFKAALANSRATFKIVITSVPIQQFYVDPYDRWEGYAAERSEILNFIRAQQIKNVVFLTTSDHRNMIHQVFIDRFTDPGTIAHEFMTGPIAHVTDQRSILNFYGPVVGPQALAAQHAIFSIAGVERRHLDAYSYGLVEVDGNAGTLTVSLKDQNGMLLHDQLNPSLVCTKTLQAE